MVIVFFNDTATTEIYTYCHTLSLHEALPIAARLHHGWPGRRRRPRPPPRLLGQRGGLAVTQHRQPGAPPFGKGRAFRERRRGGRHGGRLAPDDRAGRRALLSQARAGGPRG